MLLNSVAKLRLSGPLYDPVITGVNVKTVMEPCKQTQAIQTLGICDVFGHISAFTGSGSRLWDPWSFSNEPNIKIYGD